MQTPGAINDALPSAQLLTFAGWVKNYTAEH